VLAEAASKHPQLPLTRRQGGSPLDTIISLRYNFISIDMPPMKTVLYTKVALRSLQAHSNRAKQIRAKIGQYAANPATQANNVIQLTGSAAKRLRIGSFRVLFTETEATITVLDVGPRGEIYD
jgi:mRNA interferase RelE/StbE